MTVLVAALAGLVGLLTGSFANVAIHRWPDGGSVLTPSRSACPHCDAEILAKDNVPVVSWLVLRGRCRSCAAPIAARYPLVELATAALFTAVAAVQGPTWLLVALLPFTWALVVATAIDLEHQRIPNLLTYRLAPVLLVLVTIATLLGAGTWTDWRRALLAGVGFPLAMFTVAEVYRLVRGRFGIGMGDVKLAASIGLAVGYLGGWELVIMFYATAISGFVIAVGLIASGRAKMASAIPYGPYLALGSLTAMLAGGPLARTLDRLLLG